MIKTLKILSVVVSMLLCASLTNYAFVPHQQPEVNILGNQDDTPKLFIKELKRFVRSVNKERYQPEGYWDEVDDLWESFQVRKDKLKDQFNEAQWSQINKLERKFNNLRKKKTKLS